MKNLQTAKNAGLYTRLRLGTHQNDEVVIRAIINSSGLGREDTSSVGWAKIVSHYSGVCNFLKGSMTPVV